jgi:translation elongation factor EF-G
MQQAKLALLEPIMNVEIQAPVEYAGISWATPEPRTG